MAGVLVEGAPGSGTDQTTSPKRRRGKLVALSLCLIVLVAATGFGLRWRASYAPLVINAANVALGDELRSGVGSRGEWSAGSAGGGFELGPGVEPMPDDEALGHETASVVYDDGATVTYAVSLHNTGSVGVTVLGLAPSELEGFQLLKPVSDRVGTKLDDGRSSVVDTEPMRAFTLAGGERRSLVVRFRFEDCERYEPGSGHTRQGLRLRYRVLGLTRERALDLPVHLHVESPSDCPRMVE